MSIASSWRSLQRNAIFARDLRRSGWDVWRIVALVIVVLGLPIWLCVLFTYAGGIEASVSLLLRLLRTRYANVDGPSVVAVITVLGFNVLGTYISMQSFVTTIAQWAMPALVAPIIARERELGTWDLLRATPMTTRQILWGKFAGVMVRYPFWLLAAATFPAQLAVAMLPGAAAGSFLSSPTLMSDDVISPNISWQLGLASGGVGLLMIILQIVGLFATAGISLLCSTFARRSSTAIALAYALMIFVQMMGGGMVWFVAYILITIQLSRTLVASDIPWVAVALIFVVPMLCTFAYNLILGGVSMGWGLRRAERLAD